MGGKQNLNFEASKAALAELACACRKRGVDRALLDLREMQIPDKPAFTPTELAALVGTFHEAGFSPLQPPSGLASTHVPPRRSADIPIVIQWWGEEDNRKQLRVQMQ